MVPSLFLLDTWWKKVLGIFGISYSKKYSNSVICLVYFLTVFSSLPPFGVNFVGVFIEKNVF